MRSDTEVSALDGTTYIGRHWTGARAAPGAEADAARGSMRRGALDGGTCGGGYGGAAVECGVVRGARHWTEARLGGASSSLVSWRLQRGCHEFFQFSRNEAVVRDISGKISAYFLCDGVKDAGFRSGEFSMSHLIT